MTPLVSVITPTWQRHERLLLRCIPSVEAQTYPNVEHVVVSDGPDDDLMWKLAALGAPAGQWRRYTQLAAHDPTVRWGTAARLRGIDLARGALIAYLDDDNAYRPDHLTILVAALDASGADFAYSCMDCYRPDGTAAYKVGDMPPSYGQIDTSLIVHRRELLDRATWRYIDGLPTIDWDIVERWLNAGATWTHVPATTVDYHFS